MSYAQRPMGDYKTYGYAGDPGWLSSIWRGIKKVAPAIIGGVLGGPVGGIIAGTAGRVAKPTPPTFPAPQGMIGGAVTFPGGVSVSGAAQLPTGLRATPKGGRFGPYVPPAIAGPGGAMGAVPSGYHYAKDGSGRIVRNRRMNVANPRALRRSMRRVQGFEKLAKRTIQFTRRVKMKKRRTT